jgi:soluble lytic murein transglycosylase
MADTRLILKTGYWLIAALVLLVALAVALLLHRVHQHDRLIVRVAREAQLDPRLLSAVIWVESKFDAGAVGGVGEIGLMQITETVGKEWAEAHAINDFSLHDLFSPETNIRVGSWYLAKAIKDWSTRPDPLPYALAQYNAGRSNALRWSRQDGNETRVFLEQITYPTTRKYIENILKRYRGRVVL